MVMGRGMEDGDLGDRHNPAPRSSTFSHTPGLGGYMDELDYFTWRCYLSPV